MIALQHEFEAKFWDKYHAYEPCDILNVDETAVHYEMPLGRIWAEKGQSSRVDKKKKHSEKRFQFFLLSIVRQVA
ncbi:hypothetical protein H310_03056 [Aphanomyces invadans]|uniref:Uncharacterized protein n=1 Tax=Aphanomyces invadans TaxID=157072 RepID=A0A024UKK2_9STRA|nr:hypothetical protein H310_03056 [Aphanomyces invadans]ETW06946.1 hypothetical protein H310_03056 [Aphanomyces invadans]|eukprot:XP_008865021.1 hypothetical protein H310_03056 [Aphanomyces invadans]